MPPDDQLAPMDGLFRVPVRRKPIAAFFRISRKVPTPLIGAPDTAAISNSSKHKALPRQKNHRKPWEFVENPRKPWKSQRGRQPHLSAYCKRFRDTSARLVCNQEAGGSI